MARLRFNRVTTLMLANILLPMAVLAFASGFFPYKPFLPGLATFEDVVEASEDEATWQSSAPFNRVVLMVVDALRSDFVYGHDTGFTFTQSLIRSGTAIPFTAHATPPTVTMPRIKALTTGSVPSFFDLILNFAESDQSSSLLTQDSWLAQLRARPDGKLVFYGDDTWLKLFPDDFFARHDGTSSFFVSDFTEVDNNVTRHVPDEIKRDDWNALIMHYLGLDHIGHKTGPHGPNMLPKQKEMDQIVHMVYEAIENESHHQDTLLVLAGDHGMNAGGNHGGSGPGETEPALLFASPKFQRMQKEEKYESPTTPKPGTDFHFYNKIGQSDVVPMLAALMGFPIPRNSLGICVPELMGLWNIKTTAQLLKQNARQLLRIVWATYGEDEFERAAAQYRSGDRSSLEARCRAAAEGEQELACRWTLAETADNDESSISALYEFLKTAQESMSNTASSYKISRLIAGIILSSISIVLALASFRSLWPIDLDGAFLALVSILYGVMMFASSYVEEEQHFWYWMTPAWLASLAVRGMAQRSQNSSPTPLLYKVAPLAYCMLIVLLHRISIRWNQTGQKHAGEPDIVHAFFPDHHVLMWLLILGAYVVNGYQLVVNTLGGLLSTEVAPWIVAAVVLPAITFKLNFTQADAPELVRGLGERIRAWTAATDLVMQATLVFVLLGMILVWTVTLSVRRTIASIGRSGTQGLRPFSTAKLHPILTLFVITQTRAPNIPLILIMIMQASLLPSLLFDNQSPQKSTSKSTGVIAVTLSTLLFSHTTYFCFGGSNSISSLDLSNAYNGVADYNIAAVGILLYASNWAGPIWWASQALTTLLPMCQSSHPRRSANTKTSRRWIDDERARLHRDAVAAARSESKESNTTEEENGMVWLTYMAAMTAFFATSLLSVMATCTLLRTHLFIWTVFSPKYLYAMAWSVGWHLVVNAGFGGLFVVIGS